MESIGPGDLEARGRVGDPHPQVPFVKGDQVLAVPKAFRVVVVQLADLVGVESLGVEAEVGDGTVKERVSSTIKPKIQRRITW